MKQFYLIVAIILLIAALFSAKYEFFSNITASPAAPVTPAAPATASPAAPAAPASPAAAQINIEVLMKDIRSIVKDELKANNIYTNTQKLSDKALIADTVSLLQGRQYTDPAKYDMNQYIRKDSIPCYACTLDY